MTDEFEQRFLRGADAVHSEKVRLRTFAGLMMGLGGVLGAGAVGLTVAGALVDPWMYLGAGGAAVGAMGYALFGLTFSVVRTVVTRDELRVHTGTKEASVPLEAVERIEVVELDRKERVRMRRARAGDFGARAKNGRVVRVDFSDDGEARAIYIASEDADVLAHAIRRQVGPTAKVKVRVDASTAEEEADEVPAVSAKAKKRARS